MKLWQHTETGIICQSNDCPSNKHFEIPLMYEDDLPNDITYEVYSWWFNNSFVDGVRIGPKINGN